MLDEKFTLIGNYTSDESSVNEDVFSSVNNIVTGDCESRLSEVETYDQQFPYKLGINGVTDIVHNFDGTIFSVSYTIDGINYITELSDLYTVYSYAARGIDSINGVNFSLIKSDKTLGLNRKPEVLSLINIERQEISVFESHYRIQNIKNMGDLLTYAGGNYFNIVD